MISSTGELYASSHESTTFRLKIGIKNQAMYGAGRQMEDMLQSRAGFPLILRMNLISDFRVVWSIINPRYHQNVECLLFLSYNKKHKQATVVKEKCRFGILTNQRFFSREAYESI